MSKASKSRRKARASRSKPTSPARILTQERTASPESSGRSPLSVGRAVQPAQRAARGRGAKGRAVAEREQTTSEPVVAPAVESVRTALEEAFFRRGHQVACAAVIEPDFFVDEVTTSRHAQPNAVARRAQLRRVFAGVMGFASVLTVVVTAKALARHAEGAALPMDTSLTVRHPIVASIDLDAPPVESTSVGDTEATERATTSDVNSSRTRRPATW